MPAEYYFLFFLAGIWTLFASINDFKTTEVPNWISYSLIAFALAYRIFYSSYMSNYNFFMYGAIGFLFFVVISFMLYYSGAFGGGDAKLLMGIGAVLPFEGYSEYLYLGLIFFFTLFSIGAIYTLGYTFFLVGKSEQFRKGFMHELKLKKKVIFIPIILGAIIGSGLFYSDLAYLGAAIFIAGIVPFVYSYVRNVEKWCLMKKSDPKELMEGDWIMKDVVVSGKRIKKSVHGLSKEDISFLIKHDKKVTIRKGIPFTIVFFLAVMAFFFLTLLFPDFSLPFL